MSVLLPWKRAASEMFQPPPRYTISQWSESFRYLSREYTASPGRYSLATVPYAQEPLDSCNDPSVRVTVLMWASQTTKTTLIENVCGFFIHAEPSPILMVQPTVEMCQAWSKERFNATVRDTPILAELITEQKSRVADNTIQLKTFPGGNLAIVGANAPSGLAARPRRVVLLDEVDRYPASAGTEGDPCALAIRRTESFWNAVIVMTSTPTIKGASRIESEFEQTDKRLWFCKCPKCDHEQTLIWGQVKWPKDKPEEAGYECGGCRAMLNDADRLKMVLGGRWKATAPFNGKRGYFLNGICSPFKAKKGFKSRLHQMAAGFIEAKAGGIESLKTWTNTFLAETWEEQGERIDSLPLLERREPYGPDLPAGVLLLTAGIDIQGDRVEMEVLGHGLDEETWGIENIVLWGNFDLPEIQRQLNDQLQRTFTSVTGAQLKIVAAALDTGHKTKSAYSFSRANYSSRVYAIKGSPIPGAPVVTARFQKHSRTWLHSIGTDTLKDALFSRLQIKDHGARFCHFPEKTGSYNEEYFRQLTGEEVRHKMERGQMRRVYVKLRERNEALDKRVYAMAAYEILRPNMQLIASRFAKETTPAKDYVLKSEPVAGVPPQRNVRPAPMRHKPGFVGGWK